MLLLSRLLIAALAFLVCACSALMPAPVTPGETEAALVAQRGQPAHRYTDGRDQLLEYPQGVWAQATDMARIGPDGKVISFEQVLTAEKFASIKIGTATKEDVLRTVGVPSETSYLSLTDLEVWSYPYKEHNVWNSLMHVHFDRNGVVQKMLDGPDPRFDPDMRFPFGRLHR